MKLDFIGIGPMRAGTSWLHHALSLHPGVSLPREKETFYFDRYFERGPAWYAAHFDAENPRAMRGEIGASYFSSEEALDRIHDVSPNAKLIVSLRDPVERAFSTFIHLSKYQRLPHELERALKAEPLILDSGRYSLHLPRWEARFGAERVYLFHLESAIDRPLAEVNALLDWLGLEPLRVDEEALREPKNEGFVARSYAYQRLSDFVFRFLADNHHFNTLNALRTLKRRGEALLGRGRSRSTERRMTDAERALLIERLEPEYAFLRVRGVEF